MGYLCLGSENNNLPGFVSYPVELQMQGKVFGGGFLPSVYRYIADPKAILYFTQKIKRYPEI